MKYGVAVASPRAAIRSFRDWRSDAALRVAMLEIHTSSSRVREGHHRGPDGQGAPLEDIERYMAFVVWWRSIEDGERAA